MLQLQGNLCLENQLKWKGDRQTFKNSGELMILLQPKDTTIIVIFTGDWEQQLLLRAHMWETSHGTECSWQAKVPGQSCIREKCRTATIWGWKGGPFGATFKLTFLVSIRYFSPFQFFVFWLTCTLFWCLCTLPFPVTMLKKDKPEKITTLGPGWLHLDKKNPVVG